MSNLVGFALPSNGFGLWKWIKYRSVRSLLLPLIKHPSAFFSKLLLSSRSSSTLFTLLFIFSASVLWIFSWSGCILVFPVKFTSYLYTSFGSVSHSNRKHEGSSLYIISYLCISIWSCFVSSSYMINTVNSHKSLYIPQVIFEVQSSFFICLYIRYLIILQVKIVLETSQRLWCSQPL